MTENAASAGILSFISAATRLKKNSFKEVHHETSCRSALFSSIEQH